MASKLSVGNRLSAEDVEAIALRVFALLNAARAQSALRNVYTAEQFAAEILCGNRSIQWVQDECRARRIKTVARRPWVIPMQEALRFVNSSRTEMR